MDLTEMYRRVAMYDDAVAAKLLEEHLADNRAGLHLLLHLVGTLRGSGRLEEAKSLGSVVLRDYPDWSELRLELAKIDAQAGRAEEAFRVAKEFEQYPEYTFDVAIIEALALTSLGFLSRALASFARAWEVGDEYQKSAVAALRARTLDNAGRRDEARQVFEDGFTFDPDNIFLLYEFSLFACRQGDYARATNLAQRGLLLDPENTLCRYALASSKEQQSLWDEAIALFSEVVERDPHHSHAWAHLALCLQRKEDYANAITASEESLRLDPSNRAARWNYIRALLMEGHWCRALKQLRMLLLSRT